MRAGEDCGWAGGFAFADFLVVRELEGTAGIGGEAEGGTSELSLSFLDAAFFFFAIIQIGAGEDLQAAEIIPRKGGQHVQVRLRGVGID